MATDRDARFPARSPSPVIVEPSSTIGAPDPDPAAPPSPSTILPVAVPSRWNVRATWSPEIPACRISFGSVSAGVAGPPHAAATSPTSAMATSNARFVRARAGQDMPPPGSARACRSYLPTGRSCRPSAPMPSGISVARRGPAVNRCGDTLPSRARDTRPSRAGQRPFRKLGGHAGQLAEPDRPEGRPDPADQLVGDRGVERGRNARNQERVDARAGPGEHVLGAALQPCPERAPVHDGRRQVLLLAEPAARLRQLQEAAGEPGLPDRVEPERGFQERDPADEAQRARDRLRF